MPTEDAAVEGEVSVAEEVSLTAVTDPDNVELIVVADDEAADELTAASDISSSGMIALIPTAGNAERLAHDGGEAPDQLHATVLYLGDISNLDDETFSVIVDDLADIASTESGPVVAEGFNVSLFNPHDGDKDTCVTLGLSGKMLHMLYRRIHERIIERIAGQSYAIPAQHEPWVPHVTLAYSDDHSLVEQLADRTGDVTFDRIRLALGDEVYDFDLEPEAFADEYGEDDVDVDVSDEVGDDVVATGVAATSTTVSYNDRGGEAVNDETDETTEIEVDGETGATGQPGAWSGILIVEGVESGDGRMFAEGSLRSAPLPLPLMWQKQTAEGHQTAVQAGRIDELWREGNEIWGRGVFDLEGDDGQEAYRQVEAKFLRGVSGDVDSVKDSDVEMVYPQAGQDGDDVANLFAAPELTIFHRGRLRGATLVQFPAFVEASIALEGQTLDADETPIDESPHSEFTITESGVEAELTVEADVTADVSHLDERAQLTACGCVDEAPPREWFEDPQLSGPTPMTVTDDGRIFGHAALWGTCHTGFAGQCVTPPRERFHEYFLLGETLTADGETVATGTITLGTGHAATGGKITAFEAIKHYDNTGTVVADITTGEDAYGLWFSGALRAGVSPIKLRALRAAKLSGDWRKFGNGLRLVALLAVNVPGFPVPRLKTATSRGRQVALVAAGINQVTPEDVEDAWERDALRSLVASMRKRVGRDDASRIAELRNRIHGR